MELIIVTGQSGLNQSHSVIQRLEHAGYIHLDPDMYLEKIPGDSCMEFYELIEAKRVCLQDAWMTVAKGSPVVMNGDFIGESDLRPFHDLECSIEFIDADTPLHSLLRTLVQKHRYSKTPISEHWMHFELFHLLSA